MWRIIIVKEEKERGNENRNMTTLPVSAEQLFN